MYPAGPAIAWMMMNLMTVPFALNYPPDTRGRTNFKYPGRVQRMRHD